MTPEPDYPVALIDACYPEGVPDGFPVDLFAPIPVMTGDKNALVERDAEMREKVERIEAFMLLQPQVEIPVQHFFSGDGVYGRQIFMPKGTLMTGRIHLHEHLNIILQGDVTMMTVDGPRRVKGPMSMVSAPGTKKIGYVNEDTIWMTVHATHDRDVKNIERTLTANSYAEYENRLADSAPKNFIEGETL